MDLRTVKFLLVCLQIILVQSVENATLSGIPSSITTIKTGATKLPNAEVEVTTHDEEKVINYNGTNPERNQRNITEDDNTKTEINNIFNGQVDLNNTESYYGSTYIDLDNNTTAVNNTIINPQARILEENEENPTIIGPAESAGILAGVVLLIGIVGYIAFVVWRRYLQFKYGNSEMLVTDDVYDISDLRYFEI